MAILSVLGIIAGFAFLISIAAQFLKNHRNSFRLETENSKDMWYSIQLKDGSECIILSYVTPANRRRLLKDASKLEENAHDPDTKVDVMQIDPSALYTLKDYLIDFKDWVFDAFDDVNNDATQIGSTVIGVYSKIAFAPIRLINEFGARTRRRIAFSISSVDGSNMAKRLMIRDHVNELYIGLDDITREFDDSSPVVNIRSGAVPSEGFKLRTHSKDKQVA